MTDKDKLAFDTKTSRAIMAKRTIGEIHRVSCGAIYCGKRLVARIEVGHIIDRIDEDADAIVHAVNSHEAMCEEIDGLHARTKVLDKALEVLDYAFHALADGEERAAFSQRAQAIASKYRKKT